jgi:O-methyltransferase involved in polyketide biosynthesis
MRAGGTNTVLPVKVELGGVPETLLWTLYHRSIEARRPDAILADPRAVALVDEIDYPFAERFGRGEGGLSQWQALRVRTFDREVRRFLADRPDGTVVALGEGLETQFWRVDNGRVRWLTVDVPDAIEVRERLLPLGDRRSVAAVSALDEAWMDGVDPSRGLLITAQGLLMYFELEDVELLLATLSTRFPGAAIVFDAVPRWLSETSRKDKLGHPGGFQPPPWLWGMDAATRRRLGPLEELALPRGRGAFFGFAAPLAAKAPPLRRLLFTIQRRRL